MQNWQQERDLFAPGSNYCGLDVLTVTIDEGAQRGIGRAIPNKALGETPNSVLAEAKAIRSALESGMCEDQHQLLSLLPPGGARHAIDLAFWDVQTAFRTSRFWPQSGTLPRQVRRFDDLSPLTEEAREIRFATSKATTFRWRITNAGQISQLFTLTKHRPDAYWLLEFGRNVPFSELNLAEERLDPARLIAVGIAGNRWDDKLPPLFRAIPRSFTDSGRSTTNLQVMASRFTYMVLDLSLCGGLTYSINRIREAERAGLKTILYNSWYSALTLSSAPVLGKLAEWVASTPTVGKPCPNDSKHNSFIEEMCISSTAE